MTEAGSRCEPRGGGGHAEGCVTCGDAAAWMRVVEVDLDAETARCVDGEGHEETVATELVGAVASEDTLLVHAGTAIHREAATAAREEDE